MPCTNCVAFSIDCRIPEPKRKKAQNVATPTKDSGRYDKGDPWDVLRNLAELTPHSERGDTAEERSPRPPPGQGSFPSGTRPPAVYHTHEGTPSSANTHDEQKRKQDYDDATLGNYMEFVTKPRFSRAPITTAGRVAYLGESSNLTLLINDRQGTSDVVHYPLPENGRGAGGRAAAMDDDDIAILKQRGAFLLPPRSLCDELIDSYFKWVHPLLPIINRAKFMRQYKEQKNPPSVLLLQAVLLAGSRVCTNPQLMDKDGSSTPAALTFYKRAKALYDSNFEDDRVTIVQSLLLMGWYWEGPEDVTKNVFYWSHVATIVAQGSGMHRSVENSQLKKTDKRLWKRIWWTLFTRDRSVAVALGRPCHINLDDSDVEMLTEDDFIEEEEDDGNPGDYPPDPIHVQFFLQYVKLCEIMSLVLSQGYSVASKARRQDPIDLTHSDMALADWLQNCPKIVYWEMPKHHFWSALLHSNYYTTLCLLHRAHMPPSGASRFPDGLSYSSRHIAFQAAGMITSIVENLVARKELRYCPAFVVYSLFSALIMHVYQMRSPVPSIQQVTEKRIETCMRALEEISKVWLVGKMVYKLFESVLGNKQLAERMQKAAGRRHHKMRQTLAQLDPQALAQLDHHRVAQDHKRKYDEMAIDFSVNTPQPHESYERSRPQTPSLAQKLDPLGSAKPPDAMLGTMPPPVTSPNARQNTDAFMGGTASRPQTRPATPFNPSFSVPPTPPDMYLVTRNSPILPHSVFENFQPGQLFPESAGLPEYVSPSQMHAPSMDSGMVAQMRSHNLQPQSTDASQYDQRMTKRQAIGSPSQGNYGLLPQATATAGSSSTELGGCFPQGGGGAASNNVWGGAFDAAMAEAQSPSDTWSNGSWNGMAVPSTLNVDDWYVMRNFDAKSVLTPCVRIQFFSINGGDLMTGMPFSGML